MTDDLQASGGPQATPPWMMDGAFPVPAKLGPFGYRGWGRAFGCSFEKLKSLAANRALMSGRLAWTPEAPHLRSVLEIAALRPLALERWLRHERRMLIFHAGFILLLSASVLVELLQGDSEYAAIASELATIATFVALAAMHYRDYLGIRRRDESVVRREIAAARFFAWIMREPAPCLLALVVVLIAIFVLQQLADVASTAKFPPSMAALGFSKPMTFRGQWWRMATGPLLHHNGTHLAGNLVGLAICGKAIESMAGRWTMCLVAVISMMAGSLLSLFVLPTSLSIGFSGAITGLESFLLLLWLRRRKLLPPRLLVGLLLVAVTGALSDWSTVGHTDYAGHTGGFAAGWALGLFLVPSRTLEIPVAASRRLLRAGQICAALLVADGAFVVGRLVAMIPWRNFI